ncbi:hypothetical protein DPEC_G00338380 [Dallia pectoralis]|uniref:Uncharacterized protein n=1 Tax=Dallia pectoralis TaxID=75939 RepID=A0ACC2F4H7_DALPE|nr:hypothetical protein DPEC_G00338380 [Dallia pectoralis]
MPGPQGDSAGTAQGSPVKKSKLSLKFFQKKETKRALDFSESKAEKVKPVSVEPEEPASCDQVVPLPEPAPGPPSPILPTEKKDTLVPFVGLNNLGNTCYLNCILQVLYYCPGLREGVKKLHQLSKTKDKQRERTTESDQSDGPEEVVPVQMELLSGFHSLITSVEQLQSSYLLNPDEYTDTELATPPRKLLNTLRHLNPMYEGYLQHDAQEVLQCILGYVQEASETIRKEQEVAGQDDQVEVTPVCAFGAVKEEQAKTTEGSLEDDEETSGKRKSDTEAGNAKKKPKALKSEKTGLEAEEEKPFTRSKRKSSSGITVAPKDQREAEGKNEPEVVGEKQTSHLEVVPKEGEEKRKRRTRLSWLRPSRKQPCIFSKFTSMGRISCHAGGKSETPKPDQEETDSSQPQEYAGGNGTNSETETGEGPKSRDCLGVDLIERLFQGRLVLKTRCLECECYTERKENFQNISVPVQEDETSSPYSSSEVSPDPKPEQKSVMWAISQFASVERIIGEDKYFCETCHHYTEAERSLLFDKTPEVVTIHLKCFSANGLESDPYAGLSKVNTPLHTPLKLSLEEWCAHPSATGGQHYQLFAVVMHSGVTISSGHYTTYIKMMDLKDTQICRPVGEKGVETQVGHQQCVGKPVLDYDDGEVSFSLGASGNANAAITTKIGAKKVSEGVGLLGGQRSLSSYELGASQQTVTPDKAATTGRAKGTTTRSSKQTFSDPGQSSSGDVVADVELGATEEALNSLLQYEGKWMMFDDSEVSLSEEEDFLRACSPETCSTRTPYLLFYRRVPDQ